MQFEASLRILSDLVSLETERLNTLDPLLQQERPADRFQVLIAAHSIEEK